MCVRYWNNTYNTSDSSIIWDEGNSKVKICNTNFKRKHNYSKNGKN